MGQFKERLSTIVGLKLKDWRLRAFQVEGTVEYSLHPEWKEGDEIVISYDRIEHYPYSEGMWKDHFLATHKMLFGVIHILLNDTDRDKRNE